MFKKLLIITLFCLPLVASTYTFKKLQLNGLTQISASMVKSILHFEKNTPISEKRLNEALKEFYNFGYFTDIEFKDVNDTLVINFKEKPFIVKLSMTGYKTREDDLDILYTTMGLKKGTMYTKEKIAYAKKALLLALQREGYINSVVEVEEEKINDQSIALTFNVNKGEDITITKINYKGRKSLSVDEIEDVVANKEADCCFRWFFGRNWGDMDFEQLDLDNLRIKDLYFQHGFLDATVSKAFSKIDFNTNTAQIEYTIVEGKQYKVNDIVLYIDEKIAKAKDIAKNFRLEKTKTFNVAYLRKDKEYIKTVVANKGYAFVTVKFDIRKNTDNHTVDIIYNVLPGSKVYINDVVISGNSRTLDRVIRRNIYLAPKDLYSLTDYKDSVNALKRTGYFDSVTIKKKRVSKTKMDLVVSVTEAPTGNLIVGGGYGSYDGWMFNASVSDKNIFGSGLNLALSYEHSSKKDNYSLSLTNPAIRDSIYSGIADIHRNESEITNSYYGTKNTLQKGFGLGIGRALNRHTRIGIKYLYDDVSITYDTNSSYDNIYDIVALIPYIGFNNTDDYYVPRSGVITGASVKYAGLYGDAKYTINTVYFKYFYSLERLIDYDVILRYKTRIKTLKDRGNIPDGTTFYLGGPTSVRGYSPYAFQPQDADHPLSRYFTNTFEVSFPLISSAKMRWAIFYDYGMVGVKNFDEIKKSGAGALIAWYSPVGPLQFIFGRAINPQSGDRTSNFEFTLGTKF